jgi:ligand-binding sensor domain-containing protein
VSTIKKIMEDDKGQLVLFAGTSQYLFDEVARSFTTPYPLPPLPAGYSINDMAADRSGGILLFTGKQGSLIYDRKTARFQSTAQHNVSNAVLDSFCAITNARYPFISKDGSWWLVNWVPFTGAPPSVYWFNKATSQLHHFEKIRAYKADSYYEIWHVFQQSNGTTWIYGMGLLAYYSPQENRFIHISSNRFLPNSIDYDMISDLYEDAEKNVWVSTNNGLYRFNMEAQVFSNIPNKRPKDTTVFHNAVSAIVETSQHGIWVGSWGAGVFSYNNALQPIANPVTDAAPENKSLHVSYMIERRNGEIWVGTQPGDIKIYSPSANACFTLKHPLLAGETITQLLEDESGDLWIGTNPGKLVQCKNGNWRDSTAFKTILAEVTDVMKLYEDNRKRVWVCTSMSGLFELDGDGKKLRHFRESVGKNDGLLNDGATDIVQYNDSTYLVASNGICILNNRTNTFRYLNAAEDLPAEHITGFITDKKKRLWVTLDGGLYRLNNIDKPLYVSFGTADGIVNSVLQVSAGTVLKDGRVMAGTPHDFLVFNPDKTIDSYTPPGVVITGFFAGEKALNTDSILALQHLTLQYDNTFIKIELSNLHFRDDYSILYMLEGLDKNWKVADNDVITYQYLPPGKYTLLLKSRNGEGRENETISRLAIQVNAPFWKTWWFYSLIILCLGAILLWFDQWRMKRREPIQQMRSHIAGDLHKDINATLDNISVLSEMAKMKAGTDPEKSKEFIEQIHTKSQNMTLAMEDILWSIDPGNDSMPNFMLRLKEHIELLQSRHQVQINLLVDKNVDAVQLNMEMRKDIFWLFKNGITNVVRSGGSNNRIHILYEKPSLTYLLEFDTAGTNMEELNNLRQRKELADKLTVLDASIHFSERTGTASFILTIPVK